MVAMDAAERETMTTTTTQRLRWYDFNFINAVAQALGVHVRDAWRQQGGEYALNLPGQVVAELKRIDWVTRQPARVPSAENMA